MLNVPSDAVPPVSVRASPHHVAGVGDGRERALGLGPQEPPRVGQLQAAPGADEEGDAELVLELGDLLGDARPRQVQDVRRRGERAMLGGGEEVRELLERHAVGIAYGKRSQSALAREGRRSRYSPA